MIKRYLVITQEDEVISEEFDSIVECIEKIKRNPKVQVAILIDLVLKEIYIYDERRHMSTPLH